MEIKRKFEFVVATKRRFVVHHPDPEHTADCVQCDGQMISIELAARLLGHSQRRIFQALETGRAHFSESDQGSLFVCQNSLISAMEGNESDAAG